MTWNSISFRKRMLIIMTLSGLVELLILAVAGFSYIKQSQKEEVGMKALGVASFLARSPAIIDLIVRSELNPSDAVVVDQNKYRELTRLIGATFIVIGDKQGVRLVHPIDARLGKPMRGGDNDQALENGEAYISYATGSLGSSVRGKAAVFSAKGEIIGVVSVGYLLDRLQDRIAPYLTYLLGIALLVVIVNGIISNYISLRFQRAILGFEPEEIGRLYAELDVTMSTLKEGILSIDDRGNLRSINRSACQILGIDKEKALNRPLLEALPDSDLYTVLETRDSDNDIELFLNHQHLIANRSPIIVDGLLVGAVSSFRRRDEINELTEQLSQTKAYAELLRSQTHEHRNKLNTISGLVQMGELDAVQTMIGKETEHYQILIEFLRSTIKDPLIAGMLLGKTERARELALELVVEQGSRLEKLPETMNAEDIVTILGNLIDNAFDAAMSGLKESANRDSTCRVVEVSISDFGNEIILEVDDQGCGLPVLLSVESLTQKGVSTKAKHNRGFGLYLVKQLAERYHGELDILRKSQGTRMTVYLPKEDRV
jgi:two-component system, CitB family, sensor kinase